jgi:hypothetical protein
VQLPPVSTVTVSPETVQTEDVVDVYAIGNPLELVAVPEIENGESPKVFDGIPERLKVIVWLALPKENALLIAEVKLVESNLSW